MTSTLTRRPQATAFSIEDLLDRVRRGEVRIPDFQRPLKWTAKDVRDLFDSVYRGYPIGTLLFWKREAPAASVLFGPVRIDAPSHSQALWVVDGQQRITALTAVLLHPHAESTPHDIFTLYFDLKAEEFVTPAIGRTPPVHWLPLSTVLDSELLLTWLDRYPGRPQHPEHTRRAIRLGKSIREYQVPAYVVESAEEKALRIIFKRLNTAGNPLTQAEVFNALYGGRVGSRPISLDALSESVKALGFGTIHEQTLLQAVLAVRGLDFTTDFQVHLREDDNLLEALQQTERALRNTIIFLKRDAGIAHISILPITISRFIQLAWFFHLHPEPTNRSRELLSRWVWRRAVSDIDGVAQEQSAPALLEHITGEEELSVQELLARVPHLHRDWEQSVLHSAAPSVTHSVQLNALLALQPRHLLTGSPLDASHLLEVEGLAAFRLIFPASRSQALPFHGGALANQIFHPLLNQQSILHTLRTINTPGPELLRSHAFTPIAFERLRQDNALGFLNRRAKLIRDYTLEFLKTRMRYDESDRPSLQSLIIEDGED